MSEVRLAVEQRTEFGKGAARRTRRAGQVPAVLYGHGTDPKHLALPTVEFARVVREHGSNAVLQLDIAGGGSQLALTKTIAAHPTKNYIEHVDLLVVRRGEQVTVEVPLVVNGEAAPGTLVDQAVSTLEVQAEALHIPEQVEVSVDDLEAGHQVHASDVQIPRGVQLQTEADTLVVNITTSPSAAQMEAETAVESTISEAVAEESSEE